MTYYIGQPSFKYVIILPLITSLLVFITELEYSLLVLFIMFIVGYIIDKYRKRKDRIAVENLLAIYGEDKNYYKKETQ